MPRQTVGLPPDATLAGMVKNSAYVQKTVFDKKHARFLLIFAVPYGAEDGVFDMAEALEAAYRILQDDDYKERNWQVWDAKTGKCRSVTLEVLSFKQDDEEPTDANA